MLLAPPIPKPFAADGEHDRDAVDDAAPDEQALRNEGKAKIQ